VGGGRKENNKGDLTCGYDRVDWSGRIDSMTLLLSTSCPMFYPGRKYWDLKKIPPISKFANYERLQIG